jgi:hypothetical protein
MNETAGLDPWVSMICLSLAIGFEEDRARLGLPAAVDRLRDALGYNGLMMDSDAKLLLGVRHGTVSSVEVADTICSTQRMGLSKH